MHFKKLTLTLLICTALISGCGSSNNTSAAADATIAAVTATTEVAANATTVATTEASPAAVTEAATEATKEAATETTTEASKEVTETTTKASTEATKEVSKETSTKSDLQIVSDPTKAPSATEAQTVAETTAAVTTSNVTSSYVPGLFDAASNASSTKIASGNNPEATGTMRSVLTGQLISAEVGVRRPFAVMLNNIKDAIPQSGISRAEVLYEAYVEGNITRLMMITQNYDGLKKIGSLRSCREFYIFFAKEYEATYVHFGRSPLAVEQLSKPESNSLDGNYNAYTSYRTTDRVAPHNAFTTTEYILEGMNRKGISINLPNNFSAPLAFNTDDTSEITIADGIPCTTFKPGFVYNNPVLTYNSTDGLYYRNQFGAKHIDLETGEQLKFKNILVKFVSGYLVDNYTPMLNLEGSGDGLFITNGVAAKVTWRKDSLYGQTHYYYSNGEEIVLNQGKVMTFVINTEDSKNVVIN